MANANFFDVSFATSGEKLAHHASFINRGSLELHVIFTRDSTSHKVSS
ncbi:MAG: hypothetical protein J0I20_20145 [Chloroflexi bacterium]|nr:hypothetical protein [Chloroflexota bacterium]